MKPHNKSLTSWNKKHRKINKIKATLVMSACFILLIYGLWQIAIVLAVFFYILQELFWSDHIFFNPRQDYIYPLDADITIAINLSQYTIPWNKEYGNKTLFLEICLESTVKGRFLDPYVEIVAGENRQRQYFVRNFSGKRYINLSHVNNDGVLNDVTLSFSGCKCTSNKAMLYGFINESLQSKKILVISPHADDAEIAAFGLYSQNNSFIVTLTAGETEAEFYQDLNTDAAAASRFKGRLRAWDSIAVPRWAGLGSDKVIQLGYFCLTLGKMYNKPEQAFGSFTAELKDTRFFRISNMFSLPSDLHGKSTWNSLLDDLTELIIKFQPDIILTPHPLLDPHKDHFYAAMACWQVCSKLAEDDNNCSVDHFLLYANHYNHTDMFPFGLSGSLLSVPPEFNQHLFQCREQHKEQLKEKQSVPVRLFSYATGQRVQKNKQAALGMMHDLTIPVGLKKKFRHWIQYLLLHREKYIYGDDEYFRKAIRANELFYKVNRKQLGQLVIKNESDRNRNIAKTESA
jgi:LmbE family N-acetylglucosaminyl deacetylase